MFEFSVKVSFEPWTVKTHPRKVTSWKLFAGHLRSLLGTVCPSTAVSSAIACSKAREEAPVFAIVDILWKHFVVKIDPRLIAGIVASVMDHSIFFRQCFPVGIYDSVFSDVYWFSFGQVVIPESDTPILT